MESTRYLIVGAGVTGLAFANFIDSDDYLILERDSQIGGYCKTVQQDGFVWDYSGHFFHFRHPEIERYLVERMDDQVETIERCSQIYYDGSVLDFPFQKNIHQLPKDEFIECLYDLYFKDEAYGDKDPANFEEMVYARFGKGIAEKFLVPYNEKLYACDLSELDVGAMGRFFPYADLEGIIRNMRVADNRSYNATFTYPRGGAIQYINALASEVRDGAIQLNDAVEEIDLQSRVARTTSGRQIQFEYLISSAPFDRLLAMTDLDFNPGVYHSNKVLVFNLGFDRKGWTDPHWVYFPEKRFCFYRVGFYDNIFDSDRMSLYIEIGAPTDVKFDLAVERKRVLEDLESAGVVDGHQLVSHHSVVLDPAYVHITEESRADVARFRRVLGARGVYSLGRYGGWTYCAIEDNIVEARTLAEDLNALES